MCDYSLAGIRNRLAVEGEDLVVHRFPTGSIGLASPCDLVSVTREKPACGRNFWDRIRDLLTPAFDCPDAAAVCIPPGARLVLKSIPLHLRRKWDIAEEENVTFVQTSNEVNRYRDALSFGNGRVMLLQYLAEGMPVRVISLGGDSVADLEQTAVRLADY